MNTPVDTKARLEELRANKEKREDEAKAARELQELQELELEERFEKEIGKRGIDFEIIRTNADGPIAIRRAEEVLYKRFMKAVDSDQGATNEDYYAYVATSVVFPDRDKFNAIVAARPHVAQRCANAMLTLHGAKEIKDQGKF